MRAILLMEDGMWRAIELSEAPTVIYVDHIVARQDDDCWIPHKVTSKFYRVAESTCVGARLVIYSQDYEDAQKHRETMAQIV